MPAHGSETSPMVQKRGTKNAYTMPPSKPFIKTNFKKTKKNFHWVYSDEPHCTRRREILKAHPEIRRLFGEEIRTFPIVVVISLAQLWIASWIGTCSWAVFLTIMYVFGGTVHHSLQLANHEISHNLVFKDNLLANMLLGIFANVVTCFPSSITFRYYHMDHHSCQGVDVTDTDVPSEWELRHINTTLRKFVWVVCQSLAYAFRPIFTNPKPITKLQVLNAVVIFGCDYLIYQYLGFYAILYLVLSSLVGLGLHPTAGHFIAEHYEFVKGYETYSYYGPINYVNFNVGYHNEHHDFPRIAWANLPKVRKIAPEWYDHLPHHTSYIRVIYNYIFDDSIGPWSRIKRKTSSRLMKSSKKMDAQTMHDERLQ